MSIIQVYVTIYLLYQQFIVNISRFVKNEYTNLAKPVQIKSNDTVFWFKEKISKLFLIPTNLQRLFYAGKELAMTSNLLSDYNIVHGATIILKTTFVPVKNTNNISLFGFIDISYSHNFFEYILSIICCIINHFYENIHNFCQMFLKNFFLFL